jgi:predicted MFS family arabinose efflux permease
VIARRLNNRFHYAWVVAAATFVVLVTAAGFRATPGVLILPLQHEFGWSRALIGGAVAVNLVVYGFGAPFAAAIVERYGVRRVCVIALSLVAAGAGLTTIMTSAWQLYLLWGVVVGASTGAIAVPLAAIVANRWFATRRGMVTGLLTASNASGQLVFLPLLAWIVTAYSWRTAAVVIAATALLVVAPLAAVFLRSDPADLELLPYGGVQAGPARTQVNPFRNAISVFREASRVRDFWLLAGAFFICGATTNGLIGTHLIAACSDHGLSEVRGAGLLAAIGVFDIVGTVGSGYLTDRHDPRWLLFWYYGLRGISLLGLNAALGDAGLGLFAFTVFYGLDWVATVPPTVALCREVFGREKVGVVFAWVFAAHQFGAAFAAWGAGASRTWWGSYEPAFLAAGALGVIAAALSLSVGRRGVFRVQPARA